MKNLVFKACAALLGATLLLGCNKQGSTERGKLNIIYKGIDAEILDATKSQLSDHCTVPQAGQMCLEVISTDDGAVVFSGSIHDLDQDSSFLYGDYLATISYGTEGEEGIDMPRLYDEKEFTINSRGNTDVELTAHLMNSILAVSMSDSFKAYYPERELVIETGSGSTISIAEGDKVFVEAFRFKISGTLKSTYGNPKNFEKEFETVAPATFYTIKLDVANAGYNTIEISFDEGVDTVDLGEVDMNE